MVWGQAGTRGIDDLVRRIANNDVNLTSLTILRQRRFNHDDVASLVRAMASNTHLTELYASSHPLAPPAAALVANLLAASRSLRALCVGDSSLGDEGVAALARGLPGSSLTQLDLCNKGVGRRGAEALAAALSSSASPTSSLTHLTLSSNPQLGDEGLCALCGAADVDGGGSGSDEGGNAGCGSSGDSEASNRGSDNSSGGGGSVPVPVAAKVAVSPGCWSGLRVLELQGCGVGAAGVRALAGCPGGRGLEVLRLDGNPLGPEGGVALGEMIRVTARLRELTLRGSDLRDQGGEQLAAALAPRPPPPPHATGDGAAGAGAPAAAGGGRGAPLPLLHLDLAECGLGPRTLAALRAAFSVGARLRVLCLAGNTDVGDEAVAGLGLVLGRTPASAAGTAEGATETADNAAPLEHLDVSGTLAGPRAVSALSRAVGLRHLSLVGCTLAAPGAAALAASLAAAAAAAAAEAAAPDTAAAAAAAADTAESGRGLAAGCGPSDGGGGGCWSELRELCVSGAGFAADDLAAVLGALRGAGAAPRLRSLEVGANPGTQDDCFPRLLEGLRAARPDLAVFWRSGDDPAPPPPPAGAR